MTSRVRHVRSKERKNPVAGRIQTVKLMKGAGTLTTVAKLGTTVGLIHLCSFRGESTWKMDAKHGISSTFTKSECIAYRVENGQVTMDKIRRDLDSNVREVLIDGEDMVILID
jgi:hypothetical protein